MSAIRASENRAEVALRKALHAMGLRYRKYRCDLPGCPDFVFVREKIAVFVDGDYWHARVLVERGPRALTRSLRTPNKDYWIRKFRHNVARDRAATRALGKAGWRVLRYWESDVRRNTMTLARHVRRVVEARRKRQAKRLGTPRSGDPKWSAAKSV
jgi:DNA mismatch endonuclease, patch repair protein